MKNLFLISLLLFVTLIVKTACSEKGLLPDGQEQTIHDGFSNQ